MWTAAAVEEAAPATSVVLLTGCGQRMLEEHDILPNVDHVLSKLPKQQELRYTLTHYCVSTLVEVR